MNNRETIIPPVKEISSIEMLIVDFVRAELRGSDITASHIESAIDTALDLIEYETDAIPKVPASDVDYSLL